jgi:hypothetical protein
LSAAFYEEIMEDCIVANFPTLGYLLDVAAAPEFFIFILFILIL